MPYDITPIIRAAIDRYGGGDDSLFSTAAFGSAVSAEFGLRGYPDALWCAEVLLKAPGVEALGDSHWRLRPPRETPPRRR